MDKEKTTSKQKEFNDRRRLSRIRRKCLRKKKNDIGYEKKRSNAIETITTLDVRVTLVEEF